MARSENASRSSSPSDWFFNTNETHSKNAFHQMLAQSAIALYGYPKGVGEKKLQRPLRGDRVFVFVNEKGIVAVGRFSDNDVLASKGIFHLGADREFRRQVRWQCVVNADRAVSCATVAELGYRLPVRCTVGEIDDDSIGDRIEKILLERGDDRL
ncbi:MAG TPA: hypothetical protein VG269_27855 [Tepidisphaeraceae bacterium]|jgi:hypothetical protein|nr:hypothetical protein [Tepidisphaeraceae bacterium]